jgi:hypothetical protein
MEQAWQKKYVYKLKLKEIDHLEDLGVAGRIILQWTRFICLRIGTIGGF